jgi:hypothetical protein
MITFKDLLGHQVAPKLKNRLWIFFGIAVVIAGFILYDVVSGTLAWWLALLGLAAGAVIGAVLGRMVTIVWHETEEHVISQLDTAGYIAIGLYIAFAVSREWIFGHWLHGTALTAFTLAVASGLLFGRFIGMLASVRRVIKEGR